MISATFL